MNLIQRVWSKTHPRHIQALMWGLIIPASEYTIFNISVQAGLLSLVALVTFFGVNKIWRGD